MKEGDEVLVVFRQRMVRGAVDHPPYTITPLRLVDVRVDRRENADGLLNGLYECVNEDGTLTIQVPEHDVRPVDAVTRLGELL